MTSAAAIGHNGPPSDEEILSEKLNATYAGEIQKIEDLSATHVADVVDDETAAKAADFLSSVKAARKAIELAHKVEKDGFLKLGKVVDGFKNRHVARLEKIAERPAAMQEKFLLVKAQKERERLRQIAEAEREKAEALAAQAQAHAVEGIHDTAHDLMDAAIETDEKALRIDNYATTSKASKLARTISETGAVSGLRTTWAGEIESIGAVDLNALRHYLKEDHIQQAVNAFVRDGGRALAGVRIYQKSTLR